MAGQSAYFQTPAQPAQQAGVAVPAPVAPPPYSLAQSAPQAVAKPPEMGTGGQVAVPPRVRQPFIGLNLAADPSKLTMQETPWAVNIDGVTVRGNLAARRGLAKCVTKATYADGICAVPLLFEDSSGVAVVLLVSENSGTPVYEAVAQKLLVPKAIVPLVAPTVALASSAAHLDVTITTPSPDYGVVAAYVAYGTCFPRSPWVDADLKTIAAQRSVTAWTTVVTASGLVQFSPGTDFVNGATLYVSVWLATKLGFSPPFMGTVTYVKP